MVVEAPKTRFNPDLLAPNQKFVAGIVGGLGPYAHILFEEKLLKIRNQQGARTDQQNPVYLLGSASNTPDRTQDLIYGGESSLPSLKGWSLLLESAGVDAIIMVCNSAGGHAQAVQEAISIPLMQIPAINAEYLRRGLKLEEGTKVGVMGTDTTITLGLHHHALEAARFKPLAPKLKSPQQNATMDGIYHEDFGIKSTGGIVDQRAIDNFVGVADWLANQGAQAIVAACTEIPAGLNEKTFTRVPVVDPLDAVAFAILDLSYGRTVPDDYRIKYT